MFWFSLSSCRCGAGSHFFTFAHTHTHTDAQERTWLVPSHSLSLCVRHTLFPPPSLYLQGHRPDTGRACVCGRRRCFGQGLAALPSTNEPSSPITTTNPCCCSPPLLSLSLSLLLSIDISHIVLHRGKADRQKRNSKTEHTGSPRASYQTNPPPARPLPRPRSSLSSVRARPRHRTSPPHHPPPDPLHPKQAVLAGRTATPSHHPATPEARAKKTTAYFLVAFFLAATEGPDLALDFCLLLWGGEVE